MKNFRLYSDLLACSKANISFELIKITAIAMLIFYHVSLVIPFKPDSLFLQMIQYTGRMGWIGSDILLALAGFLFYQTRYNNFINDKYSSYILKTIIRVIIPYYAFLIIYLHTGSWFFDFIGQGWALKEGFEIPLFSFTVNLQLAIKGHSGVALEGMFSLAIGAQLIALSLIIFRFIKNEKLIIILLIVLESIAIILRLAYNASNQWQTYFATITRLDAFVTGLLFAIIKNKYAEIFLIKNLSKKLLLISSLLLLIIAIFTKGLSMWVELTTKISYPFIAFLSASLALYASDRNIQSRYNEFIWHCGKATYFSYLIKLPAVYFIVVTLTRFGINNQFIFITMSYLLSLAICFAVAFAWWMLIERNVLSYIFTKRD